MSSQEYCLDIFFFQSRVKRLLDTYDHTWIFLIFSDLDDFAMQRDGTEKGNNWLAIGISLRNAWKYNLFNGDT